MNRFVVILCALSAACINGADAPAVSFLSKNQSFAAWEAKIIDWALLYVANKDKMEIVAEKIEKEKFQYYEQVDLDDGFSECVQKSCLLHIKEKLTQELNGSDHAFLTKQLSENFVRVVRRVDTATELKTNIVLVAKAPTSSYFNGINSDNGFYEQYPHPPVYVQILIEKHADAQQHKLNKEYLLARLRAVCEKKGE